jgi:quercetin dioxygenase-like cupin family protein
VHQPPGGGRRYAMGRMEAVFKDDAPGLSVSEWWLEPHTSGPGRHTHPEDDTFYVLEGTMTFFVADRWVDAPKGTYVVAPGGTPHDFENRSDARAGFLNVQVPGAFEEHMPGIRDWFLANPPGHA